MFCYGDLQCANILVDPVGKTIAIVDWEYAGFYTQSHEIPLYEKSAPSGRQIGEDFGDIVVDMKQF